MLAVFALLSLLPAIAFGAEEDGNKFQDALTKGWLPAAVVAYVAGVGTSLTPCVYPMIAITVSVFGAKQAKTRAQAAALSTAFIIGMIVLFTTTFVIASVSGGVFGGLLQNKFVIVGLSLVFAAMAASMFGAFELTLPDSIMQRISSVGGVGYGGAFSLGLVSGLVAAPCAGPVVVSMMAAVSQSKSIGMGVTFGLAYAIGLGQLFWIVGTFAAALPKGGKWMVWVKSFFGIVMLVLALYYLKNAFPALAEFTRNETKFLAISAGLVLLGLALGAVHVNWDDGGVGTKIRKGVGIAAAVVGGYMFVVGFGKAKELSAEEMAAKKEEVKKELEAKGEKFYGELTFGSDLEKAKEQAKSEGRPMIIDFGATWCEACKKLENKTFADADVKLKGGRFVAVRFDASNDDDPNVKSVMKTYGVSTLPAVIVFDSKGNEQQRIHEFIEAKDFLAKIEKVN